MPGHLCWSFPFTHMVLFKIRRRPVGRRFSVVWQGNLKNSRKPHWNTKKARIHEQTSSASGGVCGEARASLPRYGRLWGWPLGELAK